MKQEIWINPAYIEQINIEEPYETTVEDSDNPFAPERHGWRVKIYLQNNNRPYIINVNNRYEALRVVRVMAPNFMKIDKI